MAFDGLTEKFGDGLDTTGNGSTHDWDGKVLSRGLFNPASSPSIEMTVDPGIIPKV